MKFQIFSRLQQHDIYICFLSDNVHTTVEDFCPSTPLVDCWFMKYGSPIIEEPDFDLELPRLVSDQLNAVWFFKIIFLTLLSVGVISEI